MKDSKEHGHIMIRRRSNDFEEKIRENGYSGVAFLDTNILINGEVIYQMGIAELEKHANKQIGDMIDGTRYVMRSDAIYDIDKNRYIDIDRRKSIIVGSNIKNSIPSRKITQGLLEWGSYDTDTVIVIPDFVFTEARGIIKRDRIDPQKYDEWLSRLFENGCFAELNTGFVKHEESGEYFIRRNGFIHTFNAHEKENSIIKATPVYQTDLIDIMLFYSGLHTLFSTDLNVSIVTNDSEFNGKTKTILKQPGSKAEDGRHVEIYTAKDFGEKLSEKNIVLPHVNKMK
jgi:hypothetical protein